jgi:erythromycin esterase-like protein
MATFTTYSINDVARPIDAPRWDGIIERVGNARFVMIGEASHGTHDFYESRAQITRELIERRGFSAVVAEADWPDAYRVTRYVRGENGDTDADAALSGFARFPQWMWRNTVVREFVEWLKEYNQRSRRAAGFYGMDLYSLHRSAEHVLRYLGKVDPAAAQRARIRYGCFEQFQQDAQAYGFAASSDESRSCEEQVIRQLVDLQSQAAVYASRDGRVAEDEYFYAEQNARLVKNAEMYYRSMFEGQVSSWNLRDRHMAETVDALRAHLAKRFGEVKLVLWAHNSHLGDARATQMGEQGELNVGQLVRERYGADAVNIGFTTHTGTVTAADDWDGPAEKMRVNPSLDGSIEREFHDAGIEKFWIDLRETELHEPKLERAIGVIYRPRTERWSHYFEARVAEQFDVLIHYDRTRALVPLENAAAWKEPEPEETYPTGL